MPWGLKRFHESGQTHFVTFCCYHRRSSFTTATAKRANLTFDSHGNLFGTTVGGGPNGGGVVFEISRQ